MGQFKYDCIDDECKWRGIAHERKTVEIVLEINRNSALYIGRTTYSILETIKRIAESGLCDDVNVTNTEY